MSNINTSTNINNSKPNIAIMIQKYKAIKYPNNINSITNISTNLTRLKESKDFYVNKINELNKTISQLNKNKSNTSAQYKIFKSKGKNIITENNQNKMENLALQSQTYDMQIKKLTRVQTTLQTKYTTFQTNYKNILSNYLQSTFIDPLNTRKQNLITMSNTLQQTKNALTKFLNSSNELNNNKFEQIKNTYNSFTKTSNNVNQFNNTSLKNNFNKLKSNLTNLNIQLNNTTQSFNNFNINIKKIVITRNNNTKSINSLFNNRIQKLNTSIQNKTTKLENIVNKITNQINDLNDALKNNTLNNSIKDPLNQLIDQMSQTIAQMTNDTNAQKNQLTTMMKSLKNIMGQPMNSVPPTLNTSLVVQPSKKMVLKNIPQNMVLKNIPQNIQNNAASIKFNISGINWSTFDLNKWYRAQSLIYHPNKGGSTQDFQALSTIYKYLQKQQNQKSSNNNKQPVIENIQRSQINNGAPGEPVGTLKNNSSNNNNASKKSNNNVNYKQLKKNYTKYSNHIFRIDNDNKEYLFKNLNREGVPIFYVKIKNGNLQQVRQSYVTNTLRSKKFINLGKGKDVKNK